MLLEQGTLIDEFQVIKHLGSGASGDVYLVLATRNVPPTIMRGRQYALKLYHEWTLSQPSQRERIEREFKTSQKVKHPGLVETYGFRFLSGTPPHTYLVMEVVEGATLLDYVKRYFPLRLEVLEALFVQLLDAVEALHKEYVTHRDIKPQNIVVDAGNKLKLLDLGVAREELARTITPSDQFLGTIRYAAPEMLFGKQYDHTVDLYSAGATLFFMLTGKEPFEKHAMFSHLVVEKERSSELTIPSDISSRSLRYLLYGRLVSEMTCHGRASFRASQLNSVGSIKKILSDSTVELSDWWMSYYGDASKLKSALIHYLDPRMPTSRRERLAVLEARWKLSIDFDSLRTLRTYLACIENEEGLRELDALRQEEIERARKAEEDSPLEESGD
jgi:serine/threonine protein kinase